MADHSSIEWTEATWNPVTGCTKISPGCKHCYAERMAKRLEAMGSPAYSNGFRVTLHEEALQRPRQWKKPKLIFVNSMSDLFHERVPLEFILDVFDVMASCPWHTFQILTKRASRLLEMNSLLTWPPNVWMGVSVESVEYYERIRLLSQTGSAIRFLSLEPLLGRMRDLPLHNIDWVIVGGESGPKARPMDPDWVRDIRDQCQSLCPKVAFFFKQWGGFNKKRAGRSLDERTWDELPKRPVSNSGDFRFSIRAV